MKSTANAFEALDELEINSAIFSVQNPLIFQTNPWLVYSYI